MEQLPSSFAPLSDRDLVVAVGRLARTERAATADLVTALAELDARRLYLGGGFPSLFVYCTEHLHFSKHEAYHRIEAARAARDFPVILEWLRDASLSLTAVSLLRPHLTQENHRALLEEARHQPTRVVEELVARVSPRADTRTLVRRLPGARAADAPSAACEAHDGTRATAENRSADESHAAGENATNGGNAVNERSPALAIGDLRVPATACAADAGDVGASAGVTDAVASRAQLAAGAGLIERDGQAEPAPPPRPAVIRPLAPARYHLQMTISAETHAKLRRAQDLLRHAVPTADPAVVVDRALTLLVQHLERTRCAATQRKAEPKTARTTVERRAKKTERSGARRRTSAAQAVEADSGERSSTAAKLVSESRRDDRAAPAEGAGARPSRYVPAAVKRAVWARDGGQCVYVGAAGRCPERGFLEMHHKEPFACGGPATAANLELRCRAHNQHEAEHVFGKRLMSERVQESRKASTRERRSVQTRCAPSLYEHQQSP